MNFIALDSHKRYSFASVESLDGSKRTEAHIEHGPGAIHRLLDQFDHGSPVAVETVGNWYWIVGEIEQAGMVPRLVHARRAKMMLAGKPATVNATSLRDIIMPRRRRRYDSDETGPAEQETMEKKNVVLP